MILAATLALAIAASSPGDSRLIGVWESREISQGGIGVAFEFRPDGSYVDATLVMRAGVLARRGSADSAKAMIGTPCVVRGTMVGRS